MKKVKAIVAALGLTVSGAGGHYMLVGGTTDQGLGVVGQYKIGEAHVQTLTYPGPNFFRTSLAITKAGDKDLRRLEFKCGDESESFTVYFTPAGALGVPDKDVQCDDGSYLLKYDPTKNFVIEY